MARTQTVKKPDFDSVWAALQEVAASQKDTDRLMKENAKRQKETDRLIKNNAREIEKLGGRFGEMIEYMVVPNLLAKFKTLGFVFNKAYQQASIEDENGNVFAEIDITLENGDKVMIIEVKSKPKTEDITAHIKRMEKVRAHADIHNDKRKYLGAIAGMVFKKEEKTFAMEKGFFVIEPSGDSFIITAPEGIYSPREW